MKNSKEKSQNKFIKRVSLFMAGVLAAIGVGVGAKLLPEGREQSELENPGVTGTLLPDEENFRENLKVDIEKTDRQKLAEELSEKLSKAKTIEELRAIMLKDLKQRYAEEYNKTYGTNYTDKDLSVYYSTQDYAYVKDGKFYGKEKVEGAKTLNNKIAYRIYNSQDKQLEAILADYTSVGYSSEDINILGKYKEAFEAIRETDFYNNKEGLIDLYTEGILFAYDYEQQNKEQTNQISKDEEARE